MSSYLCHNILLILCKKIFYKNIEAAICEILRISLPSDVHANSFPHRGRREWGGGGWMEPLPGVCDMLQYFEAILPLVESL